MFRGDAMGKRLDTGVTGARYPFKLLWLVKEHPLKYCPKRRGPYLHRSRSLDMRVSNIIEHVMMSLP